MGLPQDPRISLIKAPKAGGTRPLVVAHAWADYVPMSFIEPHSFLEKDSRFRSINLVSNLWHNGKPADSSTFAIQERSSSNLVNPSFYFRALHRISKLWRWRDFREFVRDKIKENGVDILHSHFATTGCELSSVMEETGVPHVITMYGYDASAALRNPSFRKKYARMFQTASRILVLCETVKERLTAMGCDPMKISLWNMPAGVEEFPYRARTKKKIVRLIMAARFVEAKGHAYLLEAFAQLARKGYPIRLTLVGYGNLVPQIERLIEALGLRSYVSLIDNKLTGDFTSDYRALLNESDIFVLPSVADRHGTDEAGPALTMVCAQAAGLPVVCTPFPGSEISLRDGVTGLYCREHDASHLAEKIEHLLENPTLWNVMGRNGSQLVRESFSQKGQMEKMIGIYEEILGIEKKNPFFDSPQIGRPSPSVPVGTS